MLHCPGGEDHVKPIDCGIGGIQNSQFRAPCAASETYALGAMAYEILTGTLRGDPKESAAETAGGGRRVRPHGDVFSPRARHAETREFSEELYHALTGGDPTGLIEAISNCGCPRPAGTKSIAHIAADFTGAAISRFVGTLLPETDPVTARKVTHRETTDHEPSGERLRGSDGSRGTRTEPATVA